MTATAFLTGRASGVTTPLFKLLAAGALLFSLAGCIPIPVLDISPTAAVVGEEVTFDGSGTIVSNIPEDTVAVSYRWTFGDGTKGSGETTTHTYEKEGTYEVTLRVIDSAGRVGETMETVTVTKSGTTTPNDDTNSDTTTGSGTDADTGTGTDTESSTDSSGSDSSSESTTATTK
ncbi:MAG: PKD domain-containing protein [Burkholderiaceae bacterium]